MNISVIWGLALAWLAGNTFINRLKISCSASEKFCYSLLTGLGIQSLWMFAFDIAGITFSQPLLTAINLIFIIVLSDLRHWKNILSLKEHLNAFNEFVKDSGPKFHLGVAVLWTIIAGLFYLIAAKAMYWPTTEHDAIGSYDKLGIWIALEGKLHVSLYAHKLQGAGGYYPPLFTGSIAYMYLYGLENPKLLSLIFYACSLLIFFSALAKYISVFGASFFTLLLAWAPEYYSHAALLLSNIPSTAYISMASLPLFIWLKDKNENYFRIACLGFAFSIWLRQDLVVFAAAAMFVMLLRKTWHEKQSILIFGIVSTISFALWSIYLTYKLQLPSANRFNFAHLVEINRYKLLLSYLWAYLGAGQTGSSPPGFFLYGIAFLLPTFLIIISIKHIWKEWSFVVIYFCISLI
ncbi:MAG: hypothetical protein RMJ53_10325, partial [Chitinophagales bacterium]|nr:hypothetical protein [Chitinophagales bacterium]MDW8274612.1 hypothetical protein [Chitinophagales bacterium]